MKSLVYKEPTAAGRSKYHLVEIRRKWPTLKCHLTETRGTACIKISSKDEIERGVNDGVV